MFGVSVRDASSTQQAKDQDQDQHDRTDKTAEKNPSFERRIEDHLAAARLIGGIWLYRRWSALRWTFSDHGHPPGSGCDHWISQRRARPLPAAMSTRRNMACSR